MTKAKTGFKKHLGIIGYIVLAVGVFLAFASVELARKERVRQLNIIALEQCQKIELLKKQHREEARERFRNLDRNLRILRIPKTPEILREAKLSRDQTLSRFPEQTCPRHVIE